MFVVPVNPNAVEIRKIPTGCCKSEFDSTYPARLNGIVGQDEFQESIGNINKATSSQILSIICGLTAALCLLGGMALFIAGGITAVNSRTFGFPVLVGVGFGVFFLGMLVLGFGCCFVQIHRVNKMRKAIAHESTKYSTRSPPCTWRLHSQRVWNGGYGNNSRSTIYYSLIIDIGNSGASGNGNTPYQYGQAFVQPTAFASQQNNFMPSSLNNFSAGGFCPQCGMPRQNPTARFCSSCGQTFNF